MQLRARTTFNSRGRIVHRGDWIDADAVYGRDLVRVRLADEVPEELLPPERAAHRFAPETAAGKASAVGKVPPSSALPADHPFVQTTANPSAAGAPPKRRPRPRGPDLLPPPDDDA